MKHSKHIFKHLLVALWALALLPSACRDEQWKEHNKLSEEGAGKSLTEVIRENPAWSRFYEALAATGYDKVLEQSNKFTVFAPENSAWEQVDMGDIDNLKLVVASHIVHGKRLSGEAALDEPMQAVSGKMIRYNKDEGTFNGASLATPLNCVAGNGVAHAVDKLIEVKKNIWDYVQGMDYAQAVFIKSLNRKIVDETKIPSSGLIADTMWLDVNNFLTAVPLNDETRLMTYIVMQNAAYEALYNKYLPYFKFTNQEYVTKFNVCQDFAFDSIVDITERDTATNMFGVKVPVGGVEILDRYDASNGRVYVIKGTSVRLREKIKPVFIEGEDFLRSAGNNFVFKRDRRWARGRYDIQLSCRTRQIDSIAVVDSMGVPVPSVVTGQDSIEARATVFRPIDNADAIVVSIQNFWIEYKATVNSVPYEIYYVAYDDIGGSITHSPDSGITMRLEQKLFISMPQQQSLSYDKNLIWNNYLGDTVCFVGQNLAGPTVNVPAGYVPPLTQLKKWSLYRDSQMLDFPLTGADATVMNVTAAGEMTLWLCNTTRDKGTRTQGMLFLDYIKLAPKLPDE